MKKIFGLLALLSLVGGFQVALAQEPSPGPEATYTERILEFSSALSVGQDGIMAVRETIVYEFGAGERHGIYRDIPLSYNGGSRGISIYSVSVTDETGAPYQFTTTASGGFERIKIGDPDVLVSGVKTYVLEYSVDGAVQWGNDSDLIIWNATGDGWEIPIEKSAVEIFLPPAAGTNAVLNCYEGVHGSTEPCVASGTSGFAASRPLMPREGLTFSLQLPKGNLVPPTPVERLIKLVATYWPLVIPIAAFILMFRRWWQFGRDPKGRGTIVPEYEPPAGLSPIEVGTLFKGSVRSVFVSAQIVSLAVRGFLKITPVEGGFLKPKDYIFDKVRDVGADGSLADRQLMAGLFDSGLQESMALSELKNKFHSTVEDVKGVVYKDLVTKGLYDKNPRNVIGVHVLLAFLLLFGSFFVLGIWPVAGAAGIATALIVAVFGLIMPRVTKAGALVKEHIHGFRDYLDIAEKDRLNFHNVPEKTPELFERFLPYALALGVVDAWAKEFEGIYTQQPKWYGGTYAGAFVLSDFSHSLNNFNSASSQAFAAGSSGGGGGGFSGGGAGGGGGGSW